MTLASAFRVLVTVDGDDVLARGHEARVAGHGHLRSLEPGVAGLAGLLIEREDLMLTHGEDLIIDEHRLRAADLPACIAAPAGRGFVHLLAGLPIKCHGQSASRWHKEQVLGREQITLGREVIAACIFLTDRVIDPLRLARRGIDGVEINVLMREHARAEIHRAAVDQKTRAHRPA